MTVLDASVVVAALLEDSPRGRWAEEVIGAGDLVAPHLLPVECATILRRSELHGAVSTDVALLAHRDLARLPVALYPYAPLAERVVELRATVTAYDAWYVALAEELDLPLATCDLRLAAAPGPRCAFRTPPGARIPPGGS